MNAPMTPQQIALLEFIQSLNAADPAYPPASSSRPRLKAQTPDVPRGPLASLIGY